MTNLYSFILDGHHIIKVELSDDLLNKLPISIHSPLYVNKKYNIESKVNKEVLKSMIDYLSGKNINPNINADNYWEYYLLNKEFRIMDEYLDKSEYKGVRQISFLNC